MEKTEQIEILSIGGKIYVIFRDATNAISGTPGRTYGCVTNSSLKRVVKLMNHSNLCECAVKLNGRFVSTVAWRKHFPHNIYSPSEHTEA